MTGHLEESHHDPSASGLRPALQHYLGDIVYGALDGLVTTFAIVSAAVGAHRSTLVVIVLGIASLVADAFSMGAANYLAIRSDAVAHGLDRGRTEPVKHALSTFLSFIALGAVPLAAYLVLGSPGDAYVLSAVLTGVSLFCVGALRATVARVGWFRSGVEMLVIGALAAAVAYGIGYLLEGLLTA